MASTATSLRLIQCAAVVNVPRIRTDYGYNNILISLAYNPVLHDNYHATGYSVEEEALLALYSVLALAAKALDAERSSVTIVSFSRLEYQ